MSLKENLKLDGIQDMFKPEDDAEATLDDLYPAISVILNCHNEPQVPALLKRALESVAVQDFKEPWEVIVVNDGEAQDENAKVFDLFKDSFMANPHIVRYTAFGTEEESGYQCRPKNVGIYHARGGYICFLDYDNEFTPDHLSVLFNAITEGNVWADFVYGQREYVLDDECDEEFTLPNGKKAKLPTGVPNYTLWDAAAVARLYTSALNNFIDTSDTIITRGSLWRLFLATGTMWNEEYRRFADWELMTRAVYAASWRGKSVEKVVQKYHWTGSNLQLTREANEIPQKKRIDEVPV